MKKIKYIVAQANEPLDANGHFINRKVVCRYRDEFIEIESERVHYMDVSPKQVVSVAAAMIPFLENDDASRALMGSNMQRQAVPLLCAESPIVATGIEYKAAKDSGRRRTCKTFRYGERRNRQIYHDRPGRRRGRQI